MNRRILGFYYIISMLFLLFILSFSAYRLKITIDGNREKSESALEALRISALSIYLAEGDFNSGYFRTTMRQKFQENDSLLLLTIYSPRDGLHYLISRDQSYLNTVPGQSTAVSWQGEPEYTIRPVYENRITRPFAPGTGQDLLIDGIFRDLEKEQVYPILREIFYILLVYFLIASVFLLSAATVKDYGHSRVASPIRRRPSPLPAARVRMNRGPSAPPPPRSMPAPPDFTADAAAGLFSPTTGLGWRQHLSPRLTSELERAAGSDQDLSLMLIGCSTAEIKDTAARILESFPLRDLAFEVDSSTAAVILPDKDLDSALREAKDFKKISTSHPAAGQTPIYIGISARNGRLVSANRLLHEAERALKQAESSAGGGIVAFRADPDKYRAAIAARSAHRRR
jgi:GGDEF domain-containing protein